ncbi:putative uncharacterized protein FLJ45825 [Gorilla gorilla gorilla]|uniref:putative uncharacterized protein FLJ45825 n=1 Tax=Gorilla gorilla gorilla TaxID=9595 RepID=UPI002446297D|nr:putative uncharacterized protein FLJ45825 [Gorilla gorilla gorilla]
MGGERGNGSLSQGTEGLPSFSNESPTSQETSESWTNQDDIFYAYASMSPGAEHRGTTQLLRFQLAPIKKLEGSLQTHFLISSLHPRMTFPGRAGGGEAGSRPPRRPWAGILILQLPSTRGRGRRSGHGAVRSWGPWKVVAEQPVGGTDPPAHGGRGRPSPNENI